MKNARLTGPQAQYVINALVSDRRISERDIQRYLSALQGEIASLEERLRVLRGAANKAQGRRLPEKASRSQRNISPERRAALRKQGLYLALMKKTPKAKRAAFKTMRRKSGVDSTLAAMQSAIKRND
jgi:hypothetical protein